MNEDDDKNFEILRSYAFDRHIEILRETVSEVGDAIHDCNEVQNLWIDLYKSMTEVEDSDHLLSHVTFHRFNELLRSFRWYMTSVYSGAYDSAVRELRFILEDICQAVYLDSTFGDKTTEDRYAMLGMGERYRGSQLIKRLPISDKIKKHLISIYSRLNDYIHPSLDLLEQSRGDPKVVFFFREDWFKEAQTLNRRVSDAVFYLIIKMFPKAGNTFLKKHLIIPSLEKMNFTQTLSILSF